MIPPLPFLDPGIIVGIFGVGGALACWCGLRRRSAALVAQQVVLRSELESMLSLQQAESAARIDQLAETVAVLELSSQTLDRAGNGGLTRSIRSQAMHLLRSGAQLESISSTLAIGKREMRLIASVSRVLALK